MKCENARHVQNGKGLLNTGVCISWPPVLCLAPGPGLAPPPPGPCPQFVITGAAPQFVFTDPGPKFVFTGPGPKFSFTSLGQSGASACIYQPCPLNFYLLALAYDFYYRALNLHLTFLSIVVAVAVVILAIVVTS